MLSNSDLKRVSRSRFEEAQILFKAHRYDGSVYLCGYSIETALKAKICEIHKLNGFPENDSEFQNLQCQKNIRLKIHDLDKLLRLSSVEQLIKTKYLAEWSIVAQWDPEVRYRAIGSAKEIDAKNMLESAKIIRGAL